MKRILSLAGVLSIALMLAGCPATSTQRQQVAQAAQTASTVVVAFQQGEIIAHEQGVVSNADHIFIQKELKNVSVVGKALDSCILSATTAAGDVACIQTATTAIDQINADGGLYIKSAKAQADFQTSMGALKIALTAISQVLGGIK